MNDKDNYSLSYKERWWEGHDTAELVFSANEIIRSDWSSSSNNGHALEQDYFLNVEEKDIHIDNVILFNI